MNEETTKALTNLAKMFGSDRVLTSQEIDKVLNGILKMLVENKKETEALNVETKAQVEKLLNKFLDKYAVFVEDMKTLEGDVSDIQSEMLKKVENKISEVTYLLEEAKKVNVKEEKLELDDIVQAVMENITLPEVQEMMEISGERIIDLINDTPNTDENKISWFKIKDIPEFFTTPQTKKGKLKEGGMSPTVLRQAVDLDHSTRADGYAIVWDEANGRHKYAAAGGGGGGSGTVNSGTQYRLAYYATTGTAVSQAAAITGARVLVSDTNGVPTHSTVTTTTLGYLDATSSIQTQLNSKLSSISGTSNRISVTGSTIDISATYVGQTSITTLGTIATGVWNGTAIGDSYISSAATWNAKQSAITTGTTSQYLRGDLSLATFPTAVSSFSNDAGYITSSALAPYGLLSGTLAQFAATSSAQLASIISDETGTGALVFANSPTLVTPALGTPSAIVLTNATGLPVASIVGDTATALGVGSINLGHASDTTISRSAAGQLAVEGVDVLTTSNTKTVTNKTIQAPLIDYVIEPGSDDTYEGEATNDVNAGDTIAQWDLVYLDSTSGRWEFADADAASTSGGVLLALAAAAGTDGNAMNVVFRGVVRNDGWTWTGAGKTLYVSTTAGGMTETAPSGASDVIRVVGYTLSDDVIYFNPDNAWVVHT